MLAIPTILGAMIFLIGDFFTSDISLNLSILLIGFFSSSIFAFLTIKYFLAFVEKIGMYPFVLYRVGLGITLLLII
jgi:undecaprenyl-diphosphatase